MIAILLVVIIFSALVFVHELGHFVAARLSGVDVEEFGFGFPPRLVGKKMGNTIYSLNWIPLGGFVRMRGENHEDLRKGTFGGASFGSKVAILLAGVGMNALTAYLILVVVCFAGLSSDAIQSLNIKSVGTKTPAHVIAATVGSESPAGKAGIKPGDTIVSFNGENLTSEDQLIDLAKSHAGQQVKVVVDHNGQKELNIKLLTADQALQRGYLGISPLAVYQERYGVVSPIVAFDVLVKMIWATLTGFFGLIAGLLTHARVSDNVVGPVGIVSIVNSIMVFGWTYMAFFIASISVSLAVINTVPLPALDGGRLLMVIIRRFSKKPISTDLEAKIHAVGFFALLALVALITFMDIRRLG